MRRTCTFNSLFLASHTSSPSLGLLSITFPRLNAAASHPSCRVWASSCVGGAGGGGCGTRQGQRAWLELPCASGCAAQALIPPRPRAVSRTGHIAIWRCLATVRLPLPAHRSLLPSLPPRSSLCAFRPSPSVARLALPRLPGLASADPNVPCSCIVSRR